MMNRNEIQRALTYQGDGPVSTYTVLVRACELVANAREVPDRIELAEFAREVADIAHEDILDIIENGDIPSNEY